MGIALAVYLCIFGRVLDNNFVGDDWAFLNEASRVRGISDVAAFFWFGTPILVRPLEKVITWLLYSALGLNFVGFHMLSLLLDLANTVLLGFLAYLLFKSEKQSERLGAFWAISVSVLFAFNWTHHEAVFWYSAVNEPLTAFFRLSALVLFVLLLPRRDVPTWAIGASVVVLVLLSLLAKESAVVFPIELFIFFVYFRVILPNGRMRAADVVVFGLVLLVVFGWLVLYWTEAPAGVIENGRGGVKLTLGSLQDWLVRIPLVLNSTTLGLDLSSTAKRIGLELVLGLVLVGLAIFRRRFVWLLGLLWTIVIMLPYAALFSGPEMVAYLNYTTLPLPARYLYFITAGSSLLIIASGIWLWQEIDVLRPNRVIRVVVHALACAALVSLLALNIRKLLDAENEWDISGRMVSRISQQLEPVVTNLKSGDTLCLANLPDNYHIKWTFRNATWGVLYLSNRRSDFRIVAMTDEDPPVAMDLCTVALVYDSAIGNFVRK